MWQIHNIHTVYNNSIYNGDGKSSESYIIFNHNLIQHLSFINQIKSFDYNFGGKLHIYNLLSEQQLTHEIATLELCKLAPIYYWNSKIFLSFGSWAGFFIIILCYFYMCWISILLFLQIISSLTSFIINLSEFVICATNPNK